MKCLLIFAAFILLLTPSYSAPDQAFCNKYAPKPSDESAVNPKRINDATMFVELTLDGGKTVNGEDIAISTIFQDVKLTKYTRGKESTFYANLGKDGKKDLLLDNEKSEGKDPICNAAPLEHSEIGNEFNIINVNHTIQFDGLQSMLRYTEFQPLKFRGLSKTRGISAKVWYTCLYQKDTGKTLATDIYYSNEYLMPGNTGTALIKTHQHVKDKNGKVTEVIRDFFNFQDTISKDLRVFDIPSSMYCKLRPMVMKLPRVDPRLQFKSIQYDLGNINVAVPAKPRMEYHKETFDAINHVFLDEQETVGDKVLTKFRHVVAQDFNTGVQYNVDMSVGSCQVSKIEVDTVSFVKNFDGTVRMKTPNEFLNLDTKNYQYMGVHQFSDRDIEVDVYTSRGPIKGKKNAVEQRIIYFATKAWMKKYRFKDYFTLPIRIDIVASLNNYATQTSVDVFQFSRDFPLLNEFPKLSPCFAQSKQTFIDVTTSTSFAKASSYGIVNVKNAFEDAMITKTKLVSLLRISNLQVVMAADGMTTIRFILLDTSANIKIGNSMQSLGKQTTNDVIYNQIKSLVTAGKFTINVKTALLKLNILTTGISKGLLNQNTFKSNKAAASYSTPTTFSPGALAALGIGMLVVGALLGVLVFKIVQRVRGSNSDIPMQSFGNPE